MKQLIFATNNKHKVQEVRAALQGHVEVVSLAEAGLSGEIPETADTLQGNALQKAQWVWERTHTDCFADDTGLEVDALDGAPGVYSARYAGEHCSFDDNIDKLLDALQGKTDRKADFRTVICLIESQSRKDEDSTTPRLCDFTTQFFEGRVDGQILTERHGAEGFGYDPVFMPDRFAVSFAEMPLDVKNSISHRGLAVAKLKEYLEAQ
ncbi:MAG: RdgB/HAM1 family non-canonical purine NTP pyrophosphatase [Bacteroidales bacterium]|nr:RdgB/HAM1 family non-canonical purine NTP pyrophosphatase [Bacteroidales bacterium]